MVKTQEHCDGSEPTELAWKQSLWIIHHWAASSLRYNILPGHDKPATQRIIQWKCLQGILARKFATRRCSLSSLLLLAYAISCRHGPVMLFWVRFLPVQKFRSCSDEYS
ncbi:hypothetical protein L218DRAFT_59921 [Marasmius fiardii PR-910]|nr:hypothetical protein L218DRAFT_59921 [Marasmius fiardii PR-910]